MINRTLIAFATSALIFATPIFVTSSYAAPHMFDLLAGSWRGTGFVTASSDSDEESIRCKMRNKNDKDKGKLVMSGNCGVGSFLFSLRGWIKQDGTKNRYNASMFQSIASLRTETFAGKRSGNKLNFTFKGHDRLSNQGISAKIQVVSRNKNNFEILLTRTDPKTKKAFKVGTIKFSKN